MEPAPPHQIAPAAHARGPTPWPALSAALVLIALGGYVMILSATHLGPGVTTDSMMYIAGARQIAAGHGYTFPRLDAHGWYFQEPISWWPPLYSLALAGLMRLGADPFAAARHLSAILLGLNAAVAGLIVRHATRDVRLRPASPPLPSGAFAAAWSIWPAVSAAALVAVMFDFHGVHTCAWSEPPFILLSMLALWAVAADVERPRRSMLVLAAAAAGAACLTRYAGYATVAAGALSLVLFGRQRFPARLGRSAAFGGIAALAVVAWVVRNKLVGAPPAGRGVAYDPLWHAKMRDLWDVMRHWAVPVAVGDKREGEPYLPWVTLAAGLVVGACWWRARRRLAAVPWPWRAAPADDGRDRRTAILGVFFVFGWTYVALVTVTLAFFDPLVVFHPRMCSPLLAASVVCAVTFASRAAHDLRARAPHNPAGRAGVAAVSILLPALLVAVLGNNLFAALDHLAHAREHGQSGMRREWLNSWGMDVARSLPPGAVIFSNADKRLAMFTGRPSARLPKGTILRPGGAEDRRRVLRAIRETGGAVIVFDREDVRDGSADPIALAKALGLKAIRPRRGADAVVLVPEGVELPPPTPPRR